MAEESFVNDFQKKLIEWYLYECLCPHWFCIASPICPTKHPSTLPLFTIVFIAHFWPIRSLHFLPRLRSEPVLHSADHAEPVLESDREEGITVPIDRISPVGLKSLTPSRFVSLVWAFSTTSSLKTLFWTSTPTCCLFSSWTSAASTRSSFCTRFSPLSSLYVPPSLYEFPSVVPSSPAPSLTQLPLFWRATSRQEPTSPSATIRSSLYVSVCALHPLEHHQLQHRHKAPPCSLSFGWKSSESLQQQLHSIRGLQVALPQHSRRSSSGHQHGDSLGTDFSCS